MARKKMRNFGEDPRLLQTGRKNKRITPGIRNALIGAVLLVAVSEVLLRAGLLPGGGSSVSGRGRPVDRPGRGGKSGVILIFN